MPATPNHEVTLRDDALRPSPPRVLEFHVHPMQPEAKLVKRIKQLVEVKGGRCFKIVGSEESHQEVGIPDLLIAYRGFFIGAEVKQPGAKLRPAQRVVLYEIYRADGIASVLETVEQGERLLAWVDQEVRRENPPKALLHYRGKLYRSWRSIE